MGHVELRREMDMGSTNLEEELRQLGDDLLAVAAITADAILNSVEMLRYKDEKRLLALTKSVEVVHARQFQIQRLAYSIRVAQLPYGHDLRLLTSIPDVCIELGRIGRYAQAIAELAARRDGLRLLLSLKLSRTWRAGLQTSCSVP